MDKPVVKVTTTLLLTAILAAAFVQPVLADTDVVYDSSGTAAQATSKEYVEWGATRGRASDTAGASSSGGGSSSSTSFNFEPSAKQKYSSIQSKIQEAQASNKDVKGWLIVPGTNINEPITYNKSSNNYYVNRDWKGKEYPGNDWQNFVTTATYADMYTKFGDSWKSSNTSKNTILYGHNWTNLRPPLDIGTGNKHTMFGQLPSYTDINFATSNPYIYYSTDKLEGIWKVFAVAYCEDDKAKFPYNLANPSKEQYSMILKEWKDRSLFDFDVDVNINDRILTLSTCTRMYNVTPADKQRYIVVARLLREGESDTDKVTATANPDVKKPQF